jgi:hypothetical protein
MQHIIIILPLLELCSFESFTFENYAQLMCKRIRETVPCSDSLYINEEGHVFLQLFSSRKKTPLTFVLIIRKAKAFFETHSCNSGIAWIYYFSDPKQR